MISKLENFIKS